MAKNQSSNVLNNPSICGQVRERVKSCTECKGSPDVEEKQNYNYLIESCKTCKNLVNFTRLGKIK